jgi:hypothetical protein
MLSSDFYKALSPIEKEYWYKLFELFQLVNPQKPEKGIETLLLRAQKAALQNGSAIEKELETIFQGAHERTHRRLERLRSCKI